MNNKLNNKVEASLYELPDDLVELIFDQLAEGNIPNSLIRRSPYWNLAITCKRFLYLALKRYKRDSKDQKNPGDPNAGILTGNALFTLRKKATRNNFRCPLHGPMPDPERCTSGYQCMYHDLYEVLSFKYLVHKSLVIRHYFKCIFAVESSKFDHITDLKIVECKFDLRTFCDLLSKFKNVVNLRLYYNRCAVTEDDNNMPVFERKLNYLETTWPGKPGHYSHSEAQTFHFHPNLRLPARVVEICLVPVEFPGYWKRPDEMFKECLLLVENDIDGLFYNLEYLKRFTDEIEHLWLPTLFKWPQFKREHGL